MSVLSFSLLGHLFWDMLGYFNGGRPKDKSFIPSYHNSQILIARYCSILAKNDQH
jgi:hypothetical protein